MKKVVKPDEVFSDYMQSVADPISKIYYGEKQMTQLGKDHKFWATQPVVQPKQLQTKALGDKQGALNQQKDKKKIRQEPYPLPKGFEWSPIDLNSDEDLEDVSQRLRVSSLFDIF